MDALYPLLPGAARFRRLAQARDLTPAETNAYGAAVLDGIRALQRSELAGSLEPATRPRCASGTAHTDGARILAALRQSHAAALASTEARERTEAQWRDAYAEAMAEKRTATVSKSETVRPATDARPASVRSAPMLISARTIVAPEINTASLSRAPEAASYISAHISQPKPRLAVARPPRAARVCSDLSTPLASRPATTSAKLSTARKQVASPRPPRAAASIDPPPAYTWVMGDIGVSFGMAA